MVPSGFVILACRLECLITLLRLLKGTIVLKKKKRKKKRTSHIFRSEFLKNNVLRKLQRACKLQSLIIHSCQSINLGKLGNEYTAHYCCESTIDNCACRTMEITILFLFLFLLQLLRERLMISTFSPCTPL